MNSHLIVGAPHQGKSTLVKSFLKGANPKSIFVYDVQNEYYGISQKTGEKFDHLFDDSYQLPDFGDFCNKILKIKNGIIVLEECTIFVDPRGSNFDLRNFLVSRYHKNNYVFLMFHALRFVPFWVYNLSDKITLLKTKDSPKAVWNKFEDEELLEAVKKLKTAPKYSHITIDILSID